MSSEQGSVFSGLPYQLSELVEPRQRGPALLPDEWSLLPQWTDYLSAGFAEETVLWACLVNPAYRESAFYRLEAAAFSLAWRREVWRVIFALVGEKQPVSVATVYPRLEPYMQEKLLAMGSLAQNPYLADFVEIVWRAAQLRQLVEAAARTRLAGCDLPWRGYADEELQVG